MYKCAKRPCLSLFSFSLWTNPRMHYLELNILPHNTNPIQNDYCLVHVCAFSGPPPKPSASCFLTDSVGGNMNIAINSSPSFNSQYNVERYQVAVTPDPALRCTGPVSPKMSYTCSGLSPVTDYTITVSAINCGDQEGESATFSVQSRRLGTLSHSGW
jgi:hypothetical protein